MARRKHFAGMSADDPAAAMAEVDRLVGLGQFAPAAALLEAALNGGAAGLAGWLQLAGLRRALKQPHRALEAVHAALALSPLDFMGLVMQAGLLESLGDSGAGEAWAQALAQRPPGALPPPLAAAVAAGELARDAWIGQREARMAEAAAPAEQAASADQAWRIARFRSNVLRKSRAFHSEPTHFHYPGLVEREFHPRQHFPWLAELEAATGQIREELRAIMSSDRAELTPYIQYQAHEALAQWQPLNHNRDWTAIHLLNHGMPVERNAAQCPATMAALARLPQPRIPGASPNAMFSLLAPHTSIPAHVGVNNARLVCHLPLMVPEGCWFRVGGETRRWQEGEAFVFDDTIEHEAANPTGQLRVVLIFDVWHPDVSPLEREAVAAMIAAVDGSSPL